MKRIAARPIFSATVLSVCLALSALPAAAAPDKGGSAVKKDKESAAAAAQEAAPAVAVPAVAATPAVDAVRRYFGNKSSTAKANGDDIAALQTFYDSRAEALWTKDGAFTPKADALIAEIKKADEWGLSTAAFDLPSLAAGASVDAQAEAEAKLAIAALKYARFARGGRVEPLSLSNILDMKPPLKDPKIAMTELAESAAPDEVLRGLHPKHAGFQNLRQALLAARGPPQPEEKIDEALKIRLPDGKDLKPGREHDDVVLLRRRLKLEISENANQRYFDELLSVALKGFQESKGLKPTGVLTGKTRAALNAEGVPKKSDPKGEVDRIVLNMERWRWLPEDLGPLYVMNNIPEFVSRVMKGNEEALKQKIIVGQPTWPTPVLTSSMEFIIFHPEWGVPDGIKVKELLPRLKRASGGDNFFDSFFGGGSSGGARVLAAYKLNPTLNGRPVDANAINWNNVDIRQFSFVQPAGGENPLGLVKFRFPNRHDVYMHDTPQKGLFAQSFRALSHGCMRLDQPRKLAEVLLREDKGWSPDKVGAQYASGGEVVLTNPIPVYLTYFTAAADAGGKISKFSDLYGHDDRLMSALEGRAVRYQSVEPSDEVADAAEIETSPSAAPAGKKNASKKTAPTARARRETSGDLITNALSGLLAN